MDIAARLERIYTSHADRPALCIGGTTFTYREMAARVGEIQAQLDANAGPAERLIGVVTVDTFDTYASVLAVLRSGRGFVPLNPAHPESRNASILHQAALGTVLSPRRDVAFGQHEATGARVLVTTDAPGSAASTVPHRPAAPDDIAYLLFTSGSTGEPKGVPITRGNLNAFLDALVASGCGMDEHDRVLQMFDLTFDFSIASYLAPLSRGAHVFTVPEGNIKFGEIYRLLEEERLTVAPLVPSVLTYLRPYFPDIDLPALRLAFFCGEALHAEVVDEWMRCAPGARIINFYGPTEATVFAMVYEWNPERGQQKALNGVVSIGRAMEGMEALIVDEAGDPVPPGEKGDLALAGLQLTTGFWNDPERNARVFFEHVEGGRARRFFRTGDLACADADGDLFFLGRTDQQVKLQGYRVELAEIEHHVRAVLPGHACVVLPLTTATGAVELHLVVEAQEVDLKAVLRSLRDRVPSYMVPARAVAIPALPLNANGKIDRRRLRTELEAHG